MGDRRDRTTVRRTFLGGLLSIPFLGSALAQITTGRGVFVDQSESAVTIGNDVLEVAFSREDGGIKQIRTADGDLTLREAPDVRDANHWALEFYDDEHDNLHTFSRVAGTPAIDVVEEGNSAEIRLEWEDARLKSASGLMNEQFHGTITSRVVVDAGEPIVRWHFDVQNRGERAIKAASCPDIIGIGPLSSDGTDELVVPQRLGKRFRAPTETLDFNVASKYPSGFGTMQFTAYTSDSGGFYTAARDTEGHAKRLGWGPGNSENSLQYWMRHRAPYRPGSDFSIPYPATVGVLDGDWHDAADRYREWLLSEGWLSPDDAGLPDRVREKGAVFQTLSYTRPDYPEDPPEVPFDDVAETMAATADYFGVPLGIRWNGWQRHGEPPGLDWFPPKEGWESFHDTLSTFEANDVDLIGIYGLGISVQETDFARENADRIDEWLIRDEDGSRIVLPGGPYGGQYVEFVQEGRQEVVRDRVRRFAEAGGSDLQLDGFPWRGVVECYADHHDHPPGLGGNWYQQAARDAIAEMKAEAREERPKFVLSGEGISDFYLPFLDVGDFRSAVVESFEGPSEHPEQHGVIPLLPYALGDFLAVRIGSIFPYPFPDSEKQIRDYHRVAIGRALVWGGIPRAHRVGFLTDPEAENDSQLLDYLRRVARARSNYGKRFLAYGRMLRKPTIDAETVRLTTDTISPGADDATVSTPAIRTSAWQSASGETGFVFTNVSPREAPRSVDLDLDAQPTSLPEAPWLVYSVHDGAYGLVAGSDDDVTTLSAELDRSDVLLVVVAPADDRRERALEAIIDAQGAAAEDDRPAVERAKRRFEANQFAEAIEIAETVVTDEQTSTDSGSSATETSTDSTATESTVTEASTDSTATETPVDTDPTATSDRVPPNADSAETADGASGFSFLTALAGAVATATTLLLRGDRDQDRSDS